MHKLGIEAHACAHYTSFLCIGACTFQSDRSIGGTLKVDGTTERPTEQKLANRARQQTEQP